MSNEPEFNLYEVEYTYTRDFSTPAPIRMFVVATSMVRATNLANEWLANRPTAVPNYNVTSVKFVDRRVLVEKL